MSNSVDKNEQNDSQLNFGKSKSGKQNNCDADKQTEPRV